MSSLHSSLISYLDHKNVKITLKTTKDTTITFRNKRSLNSCENRTLSKLTPRTVCHSAGSGPSTSSISKRGAVGVDVVPPRKVLQLHNYFCRGDSN